MNELQELITLHGLTAEEIIAFFDRYGFRDSHSHSLTQCQDFIDLVEAATAPR